MKIRLLFLLLVIPIVTFSQNLMLWNGETATIRTCEFDTGIVDSLNANSGKWCFMGQPDKWHLPAIKLSCQNTWRSDISNFDELQFYFKTNKTIPYCRISLSGWPYSSNQVDIVKYITGGKIDSTYRLVRIPIDSLKTFQYLVQSVEFIRFDTSGIANLNYYVDDLIAVDTKQLNVDTFAII